MKKLATIAALSMGIAMNAQEIYPEGAKLTTIGQASVEVQYDVSWSFDAERPDKKMADKMHVLSGKGAAVCWVEREWNNDLKLMSSWEKSGKRGSNIAQSLRATFGQVFTGFPRGKMTVVKNLDATGVWKYEESVPKMRWTISQDTLIVLGLVCKKGECEWRGREWTAWFTEEIPMSAGPWKLQGLPGLILKAEDAMGEFSFTATAIEKKSDDIVFWQREYKTKKRTVIQKTEAMMLKNPAEYLKDYDVSYNVVTFDGSMPKLGFTNFIEKE